MAQEMRLRAERKFGELSAQLETAKGRRTDRTRGNVAPSSTPTKKEVLTELGVNKRHANRCEKLAEEEFEELFPVPGSPVMSAKPPSRT